MSYRRWTAAAIGGCICAVVATAALAEGAYVGAGGANLLGSAGLRGGPTGLDIHQRSAVGAYSALGYRWLDGFQAEVQGGLRARSVDGAVQETTGRRAAQQTTSFMVNARISPPVRGPIKPYAGVGAGIAIVDTADYGLQERDGGIAPAGQALAGFSLEVSDRTSLFAEYRYFKLLEDQRSLSQTNGANRDETHAALIGLRVRLGDFTR